MTKAIKFASLLLTLLMVGCVSIQPPVALQDSFWEVSPNSVGVYMGPIPAPNFHYEGNVGLLDMAIIETAVSTLSTQIETFKAEEFETINEEIGAIIRGRGMEYKLIDDVIDVGQLPKFKDPDSKDETYFSGRDFRELGEQHGISQLILIQPRRTGVARPYYGFVPTGAPRAVFELNAQIIDTATNQINWYANIAKQNFASAEWDEPPSFPGLTNMFYISLEQARDEIIQTLSNSQSVEVSDLAP